MNSLPFSLCLCSADHLMMEAFGGKGVAVATADELQVGLGWWDS